MTFFDTFQIAMLIIFLLTFGGRAVYLRLARGINPITLGGKKSASVTLVEMLYPLWLIVWIIEVLRAGLNLEFRILPVLFDAVIFAWFPAQIAGAILCIAGYGLFVAALMAFGDSWRVGVDDRQPGALVTQGVFAISRNPIFVFLNLYTTGTFLINGTLIFLIFSVLLAAALHFQILQEERFLLKTYGDPYRSYLNHTPRYL
jgi:protein-S-isoprenylcysteine O-methyltransferase Ste14